MLEFKCAFKDNGYLNKEKYGKDKHLRLGDEQCLTGSFFFLCFSREEEGGFVNSWKAWKYSNIVQKK